MLLHQIVEALLAQGVPPARICLLSLDDVALRGADLGELLQLVAARHPAPDGEPRFLLLDEIQHGRDWSGWLKRLTDQRQPWVFLATGSSATALRRGGQDAGVGRWTELVLYPWSFREHVSFLHAEKWTFRWLDHVVSQVDAGAGLEQAAADATRTVGVRPPDEDDRLDEALYDWLVRGGFPEVATEPDLREAQRHLRNDVLDRALGRDVLDLEDADPRVLENVFRTVCLQPGAILNQSTLARDLAVPRPVIGRSLDVLERSFLVQRLPNLAAPVQGHPKLYLVAPSLRAALLHLTVDDLRRPEEWGPIMENAVVSTALATQPDATVRIGFWRKGNQECDLVSAGPREAEYVEVKRSRFDEAYAQIGRAARAIGLPGLGQVLSHRYERGPSPLTTRTHRPGPPPVHTTVGWSVAEWLYLRRSHAGGTLRVAT